MDKPNQSVEIARAELASAAEASALEIFTTSFPEFAGSSPELLDAKAALAAEKPKDWRSAEDRAAIRYGQTVTAVRGLVQEGVLKSRKDVEEVTDACLWAQIKPSALVQYLQRNGSSKLNRALTPHELATAVGLHSDFEGEGKITIATIARVADFLGIRLDEEPSDADIKAIYATIENYSADLEVPIVIDDFRDGPVPGRRRVSVRGSDLLDMGSDAAVNPTFADGHRPGTMGRIIGYLGETGVDPADLFTVAD